MSIIKKTNIFISLVFCCMIIIIYIVSQNIMLGNYSKLENDFAQRNIKIAMDAVNRELSNLTTTTQDWARWDDSCKFIQDRNVDYVESNLTDMTFAGIKVDVAIYLDNSGNVVYQKVFNSESKEPIRVPDILNGSKEAMMLLEHHTLYSSISGIIILPQGPLMISSCPIITSEGKGPIRGMLIMGRLLTDTIVSHLGEMTQLELAAFRADDSGLPPDVLKVLTKLNRQVPYSIMSIDKDTIAAYAIKSDLSGGSGIVFRTTMPKSITNQGKSSLSYYIIILTIVGILFCIAISMLLSKTLLSRLSTLSNAVSQIGETSSFSSRIPLKGTDELGKLAAAANYMLEALESYVNKLSQKETALKKKTEDQTLLLDNIDIMVWYLSDPETYGAVNKAHADFLGVRKEQLENCKLLDIIPDTKIARKYIMINKTVFKTKKQVRFEAILDNYKGRRIILNVIQTPKLDEMGQVEYVICSAEDVSQKKLAEDEIKYLSFHDSLTGLYNRTYFEQELKRLDTKRQLPLSIITGDLNGLKITNDVFGHNSGDILLKTVADIIKSCCREEDIVARWGGDEYAIILPKTPEAAAIEICDRITRACLSAEAHPIQPSIALGTACKSDISENLDNVLKKSENRMYRHKLLEDKSARSSVISLMEKTLNEKSFETREHAQRLRQMAISMGEALGMGKSELDELSLLAALHDIGKIAIPDYILNKDSSLLPDEWEIMKKHPEIGYRIAKSCPEFAPVADGILAHHEFYDGSGYPQGLKGEEIPFSSRIISIVDAFDALTNDRPYRKAVSAEKALEELRLSSGSQFDPELVSLFSKLYKST